MTILNLSRINKSYGTEIILKDINLQLQSGEKAGLIGPNGCGKTTLLKIIAGEEEADSGYVHLAGSAKIGYLPQEPCIASGDTLRHHLEQPLMHLFDLQKEITLLEQEIASHSEKAKRDLQSLLDHYATLTDRFKEKNGYQAESRLNGVAQGLGFKTTDLSRELSSFSGGEKTRARLAGMLLQDLNLLLLDEPTNFLDMAALEWLEKYLRETSCAMLVVSHDRFFLDRLVSHIFLLQQHRVKSYKGNYSVYREQADLEEISSRRQHQKQQIIKARQERLVREARGDPRSQRQKHSRQKQLNRLEIIEPDKPEKSFKLGIGFSGRSGQVVVRLEQVAKSFDQRRLFNELTVDINWGDRIAVIGPNGAGKTTLLKLIAGAEQPDSGSIRIGPSVQVVYFSQEQEQLDPQHTLIETITAASEFDMKEARNYLGRYLFQGDDVFKTVGDLSGGEKSRLALARLALNSGNCLMMDEPTSHLDLPALEELEKALSVYPGTLVIVSHDRFFLNGLANRVFELDRGSLQIYNLRFEEYLAQKENSTAALKKKAFAKGDHKQQRQEEYRRSQEKQKQERRLQNEQKTLESKIKAVEDEIAKLEKQLSDPAQYGDQESLTAIGSRAAAAQFELESLLKRWEDISSLLEQLADSPDS